MKESVGCGLTRSIKWRQKQLLQLRKLLNNHEKEVLDALAKDLGKPTTEAFFEIAALRQELKLNEKNISFWMRPKRVSVPLTQRPGIAQTVQEPLGCVLIIGPWNYPFSLTLQPLISALAAGNTVVLKPSEHAPEIAKLISKLIKEYFEEAIVQVQLGDGEMAAKLVELPFDHIFFTGGFSNGRKVLESAAKNLTPVTLELGGKSPAIVLPGANINVSARRLIWGKSLNAGQTCIAPDYLLVDKKLTPELLRAISNSRINMYGNNPLSSNNLCRIVNNYHFKRLEDLIERARSAGQILIGGEINREQNRIAPTVIKVNDRNDPLMENELFGPILPVLEIGNLGDELEDIRKGPKPLAIYLFGGNDNQQKMVLNTTSSGSVCINDVIMQAGVPELPFGGIGASGMGKYHGRSGFETFSHLKSVLQRKFYLDFQFRYPPYKIDLNLLRRLLN